VSARAKAGVLTIYVRNQGQLTHNLVISQDGQTTASTEPLEPGQSAEMTLDLAPGTYLIASTILSDQAPRHLRDAARSRREQVAFRLWRPV